VLPSRLKSPPFSYSWPALKRATSPEKFTAQLGVRCRSESWRTVSTKSVAAVSESEGSRSRISSRFAGQRDVVKPAVKGLLRAGAPERCTASNALRSWQLSGWAFNALRSVYLTLGGIVSRQTRRLIAKAAYFLSVALVLALLVGISRIYLGVHFPSDVLAGWAAGSLWSSACTRRLAGSSGRAQSNLLPRDDYRTARSHRIKQAAHL
jgi:hypothetical protein